MRRCTRLSLAAILIALALSLVFTASSTATPELDPRSLGDPNAPIVIVEYSDYECPFCAEFVRTTKPQLIAQYVDTGQVYLLFRDNPLPIHPSAPDAAAIAACAADQGQFWPMHDRLFAGYRADEWGGNPERDRGIFVRYAAELRLNEGQLRTCLADERALQERIAIDMTAAAERGLRGTPAFVIYHAGNPSGDVLHGMQSFNTWSVLIDDRLEGRPSAATTPIGLLYAIGAIAIVLLLGAATAAAALAWRTSRRVA